MKHTKHWVLRMTRIAVWRNVVDGCVSGTERSSVDMERASSVAIHVEIVSIAARSIRCTSAPMMLRV